MEPVTLDSVQEQANLAVSKALTQFVNARSNGRRFHAESLGRDVDPEYCFGDFLFLVAEDNAPKLEKRYGSYKAKTALAASGGGPTGGYLVPQQLRDDLMADVAGEAIFRSRATVIPMTTTELNLPFWDAVTAQAKGSASFWGGFQLLWASEASSLTEDEPNFRDLTLKAWELGGILLVSAPLMDDARGLESWLRRMFARSLGWYEDYAFIQGSGSGQPLGVLNAPGTLGQSRHAPSQYSIQDGQNLFGALYSPLGNSPACWLLSYTVKGSLVSQTGWFINGPMEQYGLPIYWTFKQPPLGTKGDALVLDPSFYIIGDRQAVEISASKYAATASGNVFKQNQWMWRVIERVDGQAMFSGPLTIPDGAGTPNTVSPFVVLNT